MKRRTTMVCGALLSLMALAGCSGGSTSQGTDGSAAAVETVIYREIDGQKLSADVCEPASPSTQPRAAVVLLHGGGFREGSRKTMRSLCAQVADRGIVGIAIDYRLLPENTYPTQVEDALAAVQWLTAPETAAKFGVDPERIGMLGSSAGAIITATVAAQVGSGVKAAVALSPVADMTPDGLELGNPSAEAIATILTYLGCDDIDGCDNATAASPLYSVTTDSAPTFLAIGSDELVPREQAEALHTALEAAGVPTELVVVKGSKHGLAVLSTKARAAMWAFLEEHL